jgi:hypothetical protein
MQGLFDSRPVALVDGAVIVAAGVVLMILLEVEKAIFRRFGWSRE